MTRTNKILALLLALIMVFTVSFSALAEETAAEAAERQEGAVVYATATFGQKFSPFFNTTAYDREVVELTQAQLLAADRGGAILYKGGADEGETANYNGTDYTYKGAGNLEVVQNDDGSVDYHLTMRDDIYFTDGEKATIDDIQAKSHFKTTNIEDGVAVGAGGGGSLSTKMTKEDAA